MTQTKETPDYRQALKSRRKKKLLEEKIQKKPPAVLPKKEIIVSEVVHIKQWIKKDWGEEGYNRFCAVLKNYPEYEKIPYRLFHWVIILGRGIEGMREIYEAEIVQHRKLDVNGKVRENV